MECLPCVVYSFMGRLAAYFGILALFMVISCVILKCVGEWRERNSDDGGEGENSPLMAQCNYVSKTFTVYGACQQDLESGNCSSSSSSSSSGSSSNNNRKCSEELYDAKICVICYDQQRNCFFVPCGHCATCQVCAQRIFHKENRICPVCRRLIGKVRRLYNS